MSKVAKGVKYKCRLKEVDKDKFNKLYSGIDFTCRDCMNDCKSIDGSMDVTDCQNKKLREDINDLIEMIKDENINLVKFCEDYNLKLDILLDMLKGNKILSYKYYWTLCDRLGKVKDGIEMNREYQSLFEDGDCN